MSKATPDTSSLAPNSKTILITGGAGFIGVNAALYFADKGWDIAILDNLSRRGTEDNLRWLRERVAVRFELADIREPATVNRIVGDIRPDVLLHLAAQVAVTTSVSDPREDFAINAFGTFNMLEAVRRHSPESFFINASTNKVYGKMDEVGVVERNGRYEYRDLLDGVDERQLLDFHSPYGCSKGTADQYAIDYSRIYGLKTVTFRQSCIYGTRQIWLGLTKRRICTETKQAGKRSTSVADRGIRCRYWNCSVIWRRSWVLKFRCAGATGGRAISRCSSVTWAKRSACWAGDPRLASGRVFVSSSTGLARTRRCLIG